jgi:hypothetical protein
LAAPIIYRQGLFGAPRVVGLHGVDAGDYLYGVSNLDLPAVTSQRCWFATTEISMPGR